VVRLGQRNGENGAQRWVCAKRGDEIKKKKYTSYEEFGPKELKEYRKKVSDVQNLIFKQNLIEFK
jgi:hypothetical protein